MVYISYLCLDERLLLRLRLDIVEVESIPRLTLYPIYNTWNAYNQQKTCCLLLWFSYDYYVNSFGGCSYNVKLCKSRVGRHTWHIKP